MAMALEVDLRSVAQINEVTHKLTSKQMQIPLAEASATCPANLDKGAGARP